MGFIRDLTLSRKEVAHCKKKTNSAICVNIDSVAPSSVQESYLHSFFLFLSLIFLYSSIFSFDFPSLMYFSPRSRSRSHSRERNYPSRDYQSNRGYNRGFRGYRRPFQYRGRGRGYFPRGNYHRGGSNYGYRSNNWHGHRDQQQQQQQYDHSYSPRRGRSRSHTPRKRSASRSRSRHSDRSSSVHSRHSSSSSRSSSPRRRNSSVGRLHSKDHKETGSPSESKGTSKESSKPTGSTPEEPSSKWVGLTDYDASPKRKAASSSGPSEIKVSISGAGNGGTLWRSIGPASKSPPAKASSSAGFGLFSKEDLKTEDKSASISTAFKKYVFAFGFGCFPSLYFVLQAVFNQSSFSQMCLVLVQQQRSLEE